MPSLRTRKALIGVLAAGTVLMFPGVSMGDAYVVRATSENTWNPPARTIRRNDVIRWKNPSGRYHNIRSYGANWSFSRELPAGEVRRRRFRKRGTFKYYCSIHARVRDGVCEGSMCGVIQVTL